MKTTLLKSVAWIPLGALLVASAARANDGFNSEFSHFAGNAAIAGVTTVVVDKYFPKVKRPALTGFVVSTSESFLGELAGRMSGNKFSLLDAAVGTVGAAVGAYATDKWYITPKVSSQKRETTYGVMVGCRF
jgi:hypothetical protein